MSKPSPNPRTSSPEQPGGPCRHNGIAHRASRQRVLAADVEEAVTARGREAADGHRLDHRERVAFEQHAVLEGAWLALVGVADHVVRHRRLTPDRRPIYGRSETRRRHGPAGARRRLRRSRLRDQARWPGPAPDSLQPRGSFPGWRGRSSPHAPATGQDRCRRRYAGRVRAGHDPRREPAHRHRAPARRRNALRQDRRATPARRTRRRIGPGTAIAARPRRSLIVDVHRHHRWLQLAWTRGCHHAAVAPAETRARGTAARRRVACRRCRRRRAPRRPGAAPRRAGDRT